jgi:outer membrane protein assembly factor BamB
MRLMTRLFSAGATAAAAFVLLATVAPAADKPADSAEKAGATAKTEVEPGFTSIFNGKDLSGWVYGNRKDKDGKDVPNKSGEGYRVEDGVIYSTKEDGGNLYTEKEYANFALRFEFKLTTNANNGIGIRAPLEGDSAYVGMEIQVLDDSGPEYKNLRPAQYHGSIYDVFPAKRGSQKPVGEWNTEEIVADGRHVTVTVNGQRIVDANLDEAMDAATLKKHPGLQNKTGHIGFLGHGARVEFRNLRVKEL